MDENKTQKWIDVNIAPIVKAGVDRHVAESDIKLPPLPEPRIVSYQVDSTMRRDELRTYCESDMRAYARAAVEADRTARVNNEPSIGLQHVASAKAVSTDAWIDAANAYADKYDGDDRQDIKTDIMNAFYQGGQWMRKHVQSVPSATSDVHDNNSVPVGFGAGPAASAEAPVYKDEDDFNRNASTAELGAWQRGWNDCRAQDAASAEPYAHEYGRSNGDGTYSVVIERGQPRQPVEDWPVKPLYAVPVAAQPIEAQYDRENLMRAIVEAAIRLSIARADIGQVSGPECLQLLHDIEEQAAKVLEHISVIEERDHLREVVSAQPSVPESVVHVLNKLWGSIQGIEHMPIWQDVARARADLGLAPAPKEDQS